VLLWSEVCFEEVEDSTCFFGNLILLLAASGICQDGPALLRRPVARAVNRWEISVI